MKNVSKKLIVLSLITTVVVATTHAQSVYEPYHFSTLAGTAPGSADGTGSSARFNSPNSVAVDSAGNIYAADLSNHTIRKITTGGVVTTLAGLAGVAGSSDGTGAGARFNSPEGVAVDAANNVLVADSGNSTIRKITPAGVVTTIAGQAGITGSSDGPANTATFFGPAGVAVDSIGTIYVADANNYTIRAISGGVVSTFAGSPGAYGNVDGMGSAARFALPVSVTVDSAGNLYVTDNFSYTIRAITPAGQVTTLAGTPFVIGNADGVGIAARFSQPSGVTADNLGNLYVTDANNNAVRKIVISTASVTTYAGSVLGSPGSTDATGTSARFNLPSGLSVTASGTIYVADANNCTIRKITSAAVVTTLAGSPSVGTANGVGSAARFDFPQGMAFDAAGNAYVGDSNTATIRKITPSAAVTTLAGSSYNFGNQDGTGSGASFSAMRLIAADAAGNVYVADTLNQTIRKVTPAGVVTTLAGMAGVVGSSDGTGSAARFRNPRGIAVDGSGNLYVADSDNGTIRKITSGNVVTTLAGLAGNFGSADGTGNAARFFALRGLALDSSGNLYAADGVAATIRKITPAGVVTTFAGSFGNTGSADGTGAAAQFNTPFATAVDNADNVYVTDIGSNTVRKITPAGATTTLAGLPNAVGTNDGVGIDVRFGSPRGTAVNSQGRIYVADAGNHTIRAGTPCFQSTATATNFNGTAISQGKYIWFSSIMKPSGLGSNPVTIRFTQQTITSANFTLSVPDAAVTFDPAATSATTTFTGGIWVTRVPSSGVSGNTFLSGLSYQVPANLPGGMQNVSWSGTMTVDTAGVDVNWQWGAAVYSTFNTDLTMVSVKPVDDNHASVYQNSDHAGTPENYKSFVTGGATGGGGSNFTGGYSGTPSVQTCR